MGTEQIQPIKQNTTEIPLISIHIENDKLNIGDVVIGQIIIQPMRTYCISSIELKITSKEGWTIPSIFDPRQYSLTNELMKCKIDLSPLSPNQDGIVNLIPNKYVIPFNFDISPNFIPSFRYPLQTKTAFLYHSLIAEMTSIIGEKWTSTQPIAIVSLYPQRTSPLIQESIKENFKMGLFSQGSNTVTASFNQTVYKYNDLIKFNVFIDNSACQATVNKIDIFLVRRLVFKQNGIEQFKLEKEMNKECRTVQVLAGEKKTIEVSIHFRNNDKKEFEDSNINMYQPRCNDLNELVTSVATSLIYCEYMLRIFVGYSGMTSNDDVPRIIMPIFTGRLKGCKEGDGGEGMVTPSYEDINQMSSEYEMIPAKNCVEDMMKVKETEK